jgi:structural maintenance of chromosome 3 (chondroitin sulfate proteoglycan 6)
LRELEEEKEELKAYQKLDKQRRALEYTIYDKELNQNITALEEIERERMQESDRASVIHAKATQAHDTLRSVEKEIKSISTEITQLSKDKEQVEEERQQAITERSKLELDVKDSQAKLQREMANQVKKLSPPPLQLR